VHDHAPFEALLVQARMVYANCVAIATSALDGIWRVLSAR
jgi:hypothetical protein